MTRIIVVCRNLEFLQDYVATLARERPGSTITANPTAKDLDWERWMYGDVKGCVIDCEAFDEFTSFQDIPGLVETVSQSTHLLLLNTSVRPDIADVLIEQFPYAKIKDGLVPPNRLPALVPVGDYAPANVGEWDRQLPIAHWSGVGDDVQGEVRNDEHIALVLNRLRGPIHFDDDRLQDEYVTKNSQIHLDETTAEGLPSIFDIEHSVDSILTFLRAARGDFAGRLVTGEKGAGKTTLTHFAAAKYRNERDDLLFLSIDYQWLPIYEMVEHVGFLTEQFLELFGADDLQDPNELRDRAMKVLATGSWREGQMPELPIRMRIRHLTQAPAVRMGMYRHFSGEFDRIDSLIDDYGQEREELLREADEWLRSKEDARELMVHCLLFVLSCEQGSFVDFSWARILASVLREGRRNPIAEKALEEVLSPKLVQKWREIAVSAPELMAEARLKQLSLSVLASKILYALRETLKLVLFVDNLDQRFSEDFEARLLRYAMNFVQEVRDIVPCDVLVCVRNATATSVPFMRLGIRNLTGWQEIQITPPHLPTLLRRRIERMRESGDFVGTTAWWFVNYLHEWVVTRENELLPRQTLSVIHYRHPQNVRSQLDVFCDGATSSIVLRHRHRMTRIGSSWADVSSDFCLRALIWGTQTYYREQPGSIVLNFFDNQHSKSPFNALLRPMVLGWCQHRQPVFEADVIQYFSGLGVPEKEIVDAFSACAEHQLLRIQYGGSRWNLTRWGSFFMEEVAYNLPYIQVIWWDIPMPREFDLGSPRLLEWVELEETTNVFESWLHCEEELANSNLETSVTDILGYSMAARVWENVAFSLNKIEWSVSQRSRRGLRH